MHCFSGNLKTAISILRIKLQSHSPKIILYNNAQLWWHTQAFGWGGEGGGDHFKFVFNHKYCTVLKQKLGNTQSHLPLPKKEHRHTQTSFEQTPPKQLKYILTHKWRSLHDMFAMPLKFDICTATNPSYIKSMVKQNRGQTLPMYGVDRGKKWLKS